MWPTSDSTLLASGPTLSAAVSRLCCRRHGCRGKRFRVVGMHHHQPMLLARLDCLHWRVLTSIDVIMGLQHSRVEPIAQHLLVPGDGGRPSGTMRPRLSRGLKVWHFPFSFGDPTQQAGILPPVEILFYCEASSAGWCVEVNEHMISGSIMNYHDELLEYINYTLSLSLFNIFFFIWNMIFYIFTTNRATTNFRVFRIQDFPL